jgi:hypothetical protein
MGAVLFFLFWPRLSSGRRFLWEFLATLLGHGEQAKDWGSRLRESACAMKARQKRVHSEFVSSQAGWGLLTNQHSCKFHQYYNKNK